MRGQNLITDKNLILVPIKGIGHSLVSFFVAGGARFEPEKQAGIAHLLEHAIMASPPYTRYYYQYAETRTDFIQFTHQQQAVDTLDAMEVLAENVFQPKLSNNTLKTQREVVVTELLESGDQATHSNIFNYIYGTDTPSARGLGGTAESISQLAIEHVRDFHKHFVKPKRSVIVVAGDVSVDEILEHAHKLNLIHDRFDFERPTTNTKEKYIVGALYSRDPLIETHFFVPTPSIYMTDERTHMEVLRRCIAGCDFSLLNVLFKKKYGMAYSISSDSLYGVDGGYITFSYTTSVKHAGVSAEKVEVILPNLAEHIDKSLLSLAKKRAVLDAIYASTALEEISEQSGVSLLLTGSVQTTEEIMQTIKKTTMDDIHTLVDMYFTLPHHAVAFGADINSTGSSSA